MRGKSSLASIIVQDLTRGFMGHLTLLLLLLVGTTISLTWRKAASIGLITTSFRGAKTMTFRGLITATFTGLNMMFIFD